MGNIKTGQILNVQAYKHNKKLYRQWNGVKVIENTDEHLVLFMFKTKVLEASGQKWVVREPMLWFFQWNSFYNTTALLRNAGTHYYTNLASPPIFKDDTLLYVDYDLDIKAYPKQKVKVVDKKEWLDHREEFGYSDKLIEIVEDTTKYIRKLCVDKEGYFHEDVVNKYVQKLITGKQLSSKWKKKR